eukprot:TRINITY_DN6863_c1_g1_i1.p1 TRINITY_DN6863_c1_g1~~TRINITY_DN6863_c1_g1_i1.p1  ORF type:complete len:392 (-),score=103.97 TRINITY_DN6863_c1_g1_i1:455-1630(-)
MVFVSSLPFDGRNFDELRMSAAGAGQFLDFHGIKIEQSESAEMRIVTHLQTPSQSTEILLEYMERLKCGQPFDPSFLFTLERQQLRKNATKGTPIHSVLTENESTAMVDDLDRPTSQYYDSFDEWSEHDVREAYEKAARVQVDGQWGFRFSLDNRNEEGGEEEGEGGEKRGRELTDDCVCVCDAGIRIVTRFGSELLSRQDELAKLLSSETGKPISQAQHEITEFARYLKYFVENAPHDLDSRLMTPKKSDDKGDILVYEPKGVIGAISAWNYPYFVSGNVIIPGLLAGNSLLFKPSELAVASGWELVNMLHKCGLPKDALHCVIGKGHVGELVASQPLDALYFTGSNAGGRRLKQIIRGNGSNHTKLNMELGGKDAVYCKEGEGKEGAEM